MCIHMVQNFKVSKIHDEKSPYLLCPLLLSLLIRGNQCLQFLGSFLEIFYEDKKEIHILMIFSSLLNTNVSPVNTLMHLPIVCFYFYLLSIYIYKGLPHSF